MPSAPDFIEAGFTTPAAFEASLTPTTAETIPTVNGGSTQAAETGAGGFGTVGSGDLFAAAAGVNGFSGFDGGLDIESRAPLTPTAQRAGVSAEAIALLPLLATLATVGYVWWRRRK